MQDFDTENACLHCTVVLEGADVGGGVTGRGDYWKNLFFRENWEGRHVCEFCIQHSPSAGASSAVKISQSGSRLDSCALERQGEQEKCKVWKVSNANSACWSAENQPDKKISTVLVKRINWVRLRGRTCIRNRTELHGSGLNCFLFWHSLFCSSHRGIEGNVACCVCVQLQKSV